MGRIALAAAYNRGRPPWPTWPTPSEEHTNKDADPPAGRPARPRAACLFVLGGAWLPKLGRAPERV